MNRDDWMKQLHKNQWFVWKCFVFDRGLAKLPFNCWSLPWTQYCVASVTNKMFFINGCMVISNLVISLVPELISWRRCRELVKLYLSNTLQLKFVIRFTCCIPQLKLCTEVFSLQIRSTVVVLVQNCPKYMRSFFPARSIAEGQHFCRAVIERRTKFCQSTYI